MLTTDAKAPRAGVKLTRGTVVLIAADGARETIAEILYAEGFQTTAFDNVEDMPDGAGHDDPSVAVLWVKDTSPFSLARALRPLTQLFEQTPVVVVSAGIQRWGSRAALAAGAAGVVLYDDLERALGACLQAVRAGQTCVPREHSRQIEPPALSSREKQILGLVVMGYMNSQIAEQLFLAESTIKSHLSSAFGKLGVHSRHEAVHLILDPDGGLGLGILGLSAEPMEMASKVES
jgi:DNA-binding NarL/FixJ family response regulator